MSAQQPATLRETRWIGAIAAAGGFYFVLVGFGLLPVPGGPRNLHGPLWIVLLIGLVFFLAGAAIFLQAIGRANESGNLPADAPFWMRVAQYLIGVTIFASFALIGSWVTLAGDPRYFSSNVPFLGGAASIARIMFGIGALICWLATVAVAVAAARKLFGRTQA
jgi:hypothetical protein